MKISDPLMWNKVYKAWKVKDKSIVVDISGKDLDKWNLYLESLGSSIEDRKTVSRIVNTCATFSKGFLAITTPKVPAREAVGLLERFADVLNLIYRRFLDLQKAEAQAREAQIEAALERVRDYAMGLRRSEELNTVISIIFEELNKLGLPVYECSIFIRHGKSRDFTCWNLSESTQLAKSYNFPFFAHPILDKVLAAIDQKVILHEFNIDNKELRGYCELLFTQTDFKDAPQEYKDSNITLKRLRVAQAIMNHGFLEVIGTEPLSEELKGVLKRFTNVIDLTYTRFLDLRKAESQVREAQIEASLERVRSKAMSMQRPDDLLNICEIMFKEFNSLGFETLRNAMINIHNDENKTFLNYDYSDEIGKSVTLLDYNAHPVMEKQIKQSRMVNDAFSEAVYEGKDLEAWKDFRRKYGEKDDPRIKNITALYYYFYSIGNRTIGISTFNPINEEKLSLLKRFRNVFSLAYQRYSDIALAEAQAREAKIEASLEKVRTVALTMKKSGELLDIAEVLYKQLLELGVNNIRYAIIDLHNERNEVFLDYDYSPEMGRTVTLMSYYDHSIIEKQVHQIKSSSDAFFEIILEGQELQDLINIRLKNGEEEDPRLRRIEQLTYNLYSFGDGAIGISNFGLLNDEQKMVLRRFRNVFAFAYKRYKDMVQAETQAREAKIETSLERVRSKAMAMHSPDDLSETVNVFFKELKTLGIIPIRCGVGQINEETRTTSLTTTTSSQQGDTFKVIGKIKQTGHPVLDGIFDYWKLQKEYHPVLKGEDIKAYYDVMNPQIGYPEYPEGVTQFGNCFFFIEGFVFAWTESKLSDEEMEIFRRFTSVLSLTYRRYIDLKEAETRAFEAVRQASLDRVRAEIASMRTAEDLNHITPIIWRELKTLDVPFIRCGVFIVNEIQEKVQVYLTTPEGKSLGVLNLPFDSNELTNKTVEFWRMKMIYKEHCNREEFINWTKSMIEIGQIQNAETYQGSATPPESLDLHFIPFTPGMPTDNVLSEVNNILVEDSPSNMFITVFYGVLDTRNGAFEYSNGGHNSPYLISVDGKANQIPNKGGLLLGAMKDAEYESNILMIKPNEIIVFYTDE